MQPQFSHWCTQISVTSNLFQQQPMTSAEKLMFFPFQVHRKQRGLPYYGSAVKF
uniref:Uncharacterized protein n=1 Tax=Rhizophora mucronata TaxID=61149 RepID=A0A2P2LHN4_RHIMU